MELAEILRDRGSRVTQARQAVWDALHAAAADSGHVTVQEIVESEAASSADVNVSSVYRSLELFAELGLVRESRTDSFGSSTWELRHADGEIHLICSACGTVLHHHTSTVEALHDELSATGFTPEVVDVRVTGRCSSCR